MTTYAIVNTVFAVIVLIFVITTTIWLTRLERDVRQLQEQPRRPAQPRIHGTARLTRQTPNGLLDIDLHS
jgi:hypothetical protein